MLRLLLFFLLILYCLVTYHRNRKEKVYHEGKATFTKATYTPDSTRGKTLVSFVGKDVPRRAAFNSLKSQTGMVFYYCNNDFDDSALVTVNAVNKSLDETLGIILNGTLVRWHYHGKRAISLVLPEPFSGIDKEDWSPLKIHDFERFWIFPRD